MDSDESLEKHLHSMNGFQVSQSIVLLCSQAGKP